MFDFKSNKKNKSSAAIVLSVHNSLVSGTHIIGNINSQTDIRIDGSLEGNLKSEARVLIGKTGVIIGNVVCSSILIQGKVEGNINAKENLHLASSAFVAGDLYTNKLIIEDGAEFNGVSIMNKLGQKRETDARANTEGKKTKSKA